MSGKPPTRFRLELRHTRSAADGKPQPQPCRGCSSRHRELAVPSSHSGIAGQGWSAVAQEYLNGKEIVTGSTPLSPIAKFSSQGGFAELPASKVNADIGVSCSCHCCSACQRFFPRAIGCLLGTALSAQEAFCLPHHLEAGFPVSSGVGSVHTFHVLLLRGHKPFAVRRSIDPIRAARRSLNYSSEKGANGLPLVASSVTL